MIWLVLFIWVATCVVFVVVLFDLGGWQRRRREQLEAERIDRIAVVYGLARREGETTAELRARISHFLSSPPGYSAFTIADLRKCPGVARAWNDGFGRVILVYQSGLSRFEVSEALREIRERSPVYVHVEGRHRGEVL